MTELGWIKDLVRAEQQMEDTGIVDMVAGFDPDKTLHIETLNFLGGLKESFVDYSTAFNQLRGIGVGGVKIYGISNTQADFMLFRHGFKLIYSMKKSGLISIRFQHQGSGFVAGAAASEKLEDGATNEDLIEAKWGAFGEILWTYKKLPVNSDHMVRYYFSRFVKESAK